MVVEVLVCKQMDYNSQEQIKIACWLAAENPVAGFDPKNAPYVSLAKYFRW